jgi:tyrosine-protein kinase Etk/Wzc
MKDQNSLKMDMPAKTSNDGTLHAERDQIGAEWWNMLGVLYNWRRFIIVTTAIIAVLSVIISLFLPNWYKASSRLLLSESSGGGLASALLGDLGSAAQSLLGTGGGDYIRFLSILESRNVQVQIVEKFDLITVYDNNEAKFPLEETLKGLADNVEFVIDDEFDFLSVEVLDQDPQRAAEMSNFYVGLLDEVNNRLTTQTAGNFRQYVESRYLKAQQDRASLLDSLANFQRRYGVMDLEAQTEAYFTQLADLRANTLQYEIQLEALKTQFGPENKQVQTMQTFVDAAQQSFQGAMDGREIVMPVSQEEAPEMVRQYLNLTMDRMIQEKILEFVAPMLEQARFEEERKAQALQVVDEAVAPYKKNKPKRMIIVVAAALSGFILALIFVLVLDWWRRNSARFAARLRDSSGR